MRKRMIFKSEKFGDVRAIVENDRLLFSLIDLVIGSGLSCATCYNGRIARGARVIVEGDGRLHYVGERTIDDVVDYARKAAAYKKNKAEAVERAYSFGQWLWREVVPEMREVQKEMQKNALPARTSSDVQKMLADPDTMIQVLSAFKDERQSREQLEKRLADKKERDPETFFREFVDSLASNIANAIAETFEQRLSAETI